MAKKEEAKEVKEVKKSSPSVATPTGVVSIHGNQGFLSSKNKRDYSHKTHGGFKNI